MGRRRIGGGLTVSLCLLLAFAALGHAHAVSPDEIVARLSAPAAREAYGIEEVSRLAGLPRMLLVRVGPRWGTLPAERRRAAAEDWGRAWEHSVPQGIVSIVDATSGRAVVNFDGQGRAQLAR
jgi:hypothetical protein